ncbi:hypothetical protein BD309DRAFT_967143 [Dichomitus squalens]|nr:hypothetical protein BD309DRAFT_967143 [Dichomitus squalens]
MALSLFWPGKYFFYPIGNTSAVCLTRDIPPETSANILLLACGDPRNVLYTIFCETPDLSRALDFTCCDFDPGVLARNVLLLSMIIDGVSKETTWNIFFHMYLDDDSQAALVSQCQKLAMYSSVADWRSSPYGAVIRMGTDHTLAAMCRHWELYANFYHPSRSEQRKDLQKKMEDTRREILSDTPVVNMSSSRSSGPLLLRYDPVHVASQQFRRYWETGTTFTDATQLANSTHPNSTFFYSRAHEGFDVHYGTDPMIPFHHAPLFGNAKGTVTVQNLVESSRSQFYAWSAAFRTAVTTWKEGLLAIRFLLGDALAVASALQNHSNSSVQTVHPMPRVAAWTACVLKLNPEEYARVAAPVRFEVIDTSNLSDHVGMLNILLCTASLLAHSPCSVLYTESLLTHTTDSATELESKLFADLSVVSVLLGMAPLDSLSGFTSLCNTHEQLVSLTLPPSHHRQYHQIITWRQPSTGDPSFIHDITLPPLRFDANQLARLFCDIYVHLFGTEDPAYFMNLKPEDIVRLGRKFACFCPSRESFIVLLSLVHNRLQISAALWSGVMRIFLNLLSDDALRTHPFDRLNHREIHAQLYRHGIYSVPELDKARRPRVGRLSHWANIPPLVRVFLTVPRNEFAKLESIPNTPWLHCVIRYSQSEHGFQSVDAAYGTLIDRGSKAKPDLLFREDPEGHRTHCPVVVSFVVPSCVLTEAAPETIDIRLSVRTNPGSNKALLFFLGPYMAVFHACLEDTDHVHLLPEVPLSPPDTLSSAFVPLHFPKKLSAIGRPSHLAVDMDGTGKRIASLTARLDVEDVQAKEQFAKGAMPTVTQSSPCAMQVVIGGLTQTLLYPIPIVGSERKVRLARKSSYIEVAVPVAIPYLRPDGQRLCPFPVVRTNGSLSPWNLHRVPINRLPVLDLANVDRLRLWYDAHVGSQFSIRERKIRDTEQLDLLTNIKDSIHHVMTKAAGTQGTEKPARVIALRDDETQDCDTMLFVNRIRFDLSSHTIVCDAFVLPTSHAIMPTISPFIGQLLQRGVTSIRVYRGEMRGWKQLLPALVERCRTTWTHGANCEYVAKGKIPLQLKTSAGDPLCSCGRGKDVDGMLHDNLWKKFGPFVTRIAISPLFAVSYVDPVFTGGTEDVASPLASDVKETLAECHRCRKQRSISGELRRCSGCKIVYYCSEACQKSDWKSHKLDCNR